MNELLRTRTEVETHLPTIRPRALRMALQTRVIIQAIQHVCGNRMDTQLAEFRRCTLELIAFEKKQERSLRVALDLGLYD